ncbi:VOC family protein [Modestobacter sp. NPDC049651]|uniref:VOC family protein n=1 Tax=unclassified Modestobacter TaxID=2643866 RepID=UPI0033F8FF6C
MHLASIRLITDDVDSLVDFYEEVTQVAAERPAPVFAELRYATCTLAIGHSSTAALFNGAAQPASNRTAILEWVVDDVDAEFDRLQPVVTAWEMAPTTMPWGNRSILFRDPDGNLVNLFTPVSEDARRRFQRA